MDMELKGRLYYLSDGRRGISQRQRLVKRERDNARYKAELL